MYHNNVTKEVIVMTLEILVFIYLISPVLLGIIARFIAGDDETR